MLIFLPSSQPWFTVRLLAPRASRTAGTHTGGKGDLGLLKLALVPKERDMKCKPPPTTWDRAKPAAVRLSHGLVT